MIIYIETGGGVQAWLLSHWLSAVYPVGYLDFSSGIVLIFLV